MSAHHAQLNRWRLADIRRQRLAAAAANNEPCHRCGGAIDYSLDGRTRWGPQADHIIPLSQGNTNPYDPAGLAPAHAHCNRSHGATTGNRQRRSRQTWQW